MAHKKGAGSSDNGRDSRSKRLGVKLYGGQVAIPGNIIVRQRGTKFHPGENVYMGRDHTLHAKVAGMVVFTKKRNDRNYVSILPDVSEVPDVPKKAKVLTGKKGPEMKPEVHQKPVPAPKKDADTAVAAVAPEAISVETPEAPVVAKKAAAPEKAAKAKAPVAEKKAAAPKKAAKAEAPAAEKKAAAPKKAVKAEAPAAEKKAAAPKKAKGPKLDDLKIIEGIGPKIETLLKEGGISTWAELAAAPLDRLKEILDSAGPRYQIHDPSTWPSQSKFAAEGKFEELKEYQDLLIGGRDAG